MLEEGLLFAERYKFIKLLGRGGFAEVWLAEDIMTAVQVAVKVYAPGTGLDEAGIKLFTQEFSMVFDMNHTNLLRPTHFDCWNRQPYLIMPYCKNGSAFKYITSDNVITEDECWNLLHDVAAGLAYLHEKEPPLIHQDIKPDNILVNDEGHFMITDFGISARVRSTIRNGMAQEQSGGTLAYMGPERFSANPKPIMASDVWSLGAMMYELMSGGNPPFGNHGGVLQKNGADIPLIEGDYSQELKDIVYQCLARETWDRPSARKVEEMTYNHMHGIVMPPESQNEEPQAETSPEQPQESSLKNSLGKSLGNSLGKSLGNSLGNSQPVNQPMAKKPANKNLLYGGIAAVVILIGILIAVFSGGSEPKQPVITEVLPRINYDSLAQVKIQEALTVKTEADTIIANHPDDKYDSKYNKVEEIYVQAFNALNEALVNKDSLSAAVATQAIQEQANITNALLGIYNDFIQTAQAFREADIDATAFESRADFVKPYIKNLINDQNNE